jgi:nuclear receptor co-repressor 1
MGNFEPFRAIGYTTTTTTPWMPPPPPDRRDYLHREGRRHDGGGAGDPLLPPAPTPSRWRDLPYHPPPPPPLRDHAQPSPRWAPPSACSDRAPLANPQI